MLRQLASFLSIAALVTGTVIGSASIGQAAQQPLPKNTVYGTTGSTTLACVPNGPYIEFDVTMTPTSGRVISFVGTLTINTLVPTIISFNGTNYGPTPSGFASIQRELSAFNPGTYVVTAAGSGTTTNGEFIIGGVPSVLPVCTFEVP